MERTQNIVNMATMKTMNTLAENMIIQVIRIWKVEEIEIIKKCLSENELCILCICISEQIDFKYDKIINKFFMRDSENFLLAYKMKSDLYLIFSIYFWVGNKEIQEVLKNINL